MLTEKTTFERKRLKVINSGFRKEIKKRVETLFALKRSAAPIYPRTISTEETKDYFLEKLYYYSEKDITTTAYFVYPKKTEQKQKTLITLFETGTDEVLLQNLFIGEAIKKGYSLLIFDPRGIGAVKAREVSKIWNPKENILDNEYTLNAEALLLGTSLTAMRVFDTVRALDYLLKRPGIDKDNIGIAGFGIGALWTLFTSALREEIKTVILSDFLFSYNDYIDSRLYDYDNKFVIPGILKYFDLVDIIASLSDRKLLLNNPKDALGVNADDFKLQKYFYGILGNSYPNSGIGQKNVFRLTNIAEAL